MKRKILPAAILACVTFAVAWPASLQAAIVNVTLAVTTEDGFRLNNSSGAALTNGSLVRVGYFYNPATGLGLDNTAITGLYNTTSTFSQNLSSLNSKFLEIGVGSIGFNLVNGLEAGNLAGNGDRPYGAAPLVTARVDDDGNPLPGTFGRVWFDGTLPIESVGTSPYNSITNVKLTGALLSVIAYNAASEAAATELMVVRALTRSELPTSDETVAFALGVTTSQVLLGDAVTGGYATIPEPSVACLVGLASLIFINRRKANVGNTI